jgi:hypothetical protein
MRDLLAAVAVVFLALTSIGAPVASGVAAGHAVPFKGSLEGVDTILDFTDLTHAPVLLQWTGHATHLGRFTVEGHCFINLFTGFASGTEVFTAANGDTVNVAGCGQAEQPLIPVLSIVEHGTITGGTGRFAGATGTFTLERLLDTSTGSTTGSFEGTISAPGTGKP